MAWQNFLRSLLTVKSFAHFVYIFFYYYYDFSRLSVSCIHYMLLYVDFSDRKKKKEHPVSMKGGGNFALTNHVIVSRM